jgi:tRNA(fMet)-specific endonuclease VapC
LPDVTATEASRCFADLLDGVEHRGERDALIHDDDEPAIAAITVAELGVGVELASGKRRKARRAFLEDLVMSLRILSYDVDVARSHTQLLVAVRAGGRPRGAHDLIIAATTRATGRTVVTTADTGFDDLPGVSVRKPES